MRKFLISLTIATLFVSCGKKAEQADPIDTTTQDAEQILALPDTALPSATAVSYTLEIVDTTISGELQSLENLYDGKEGWFTFRGNPLRNADFGGTVTGTPSRVVKDWQFNTSFDASKTSMGTWGGGTGWTGQPLYLRSTGEIIVASLCGRVYFLNFADGTETRSSIDVTNPIKGTCSLEPTNRRLLFVGQGIPKVPPMGQIAIDLKRHERVFFSGADRKAGRSWGAFDSSPVRVGDFLFWPGENGTIYKYKVQDSTITLHTAMRYRCRGVAPGVENSLCVYRNYGFFGDNHGNIICINLSTMRPVWHYDNHDDIDGSIVCEVEDGVPFIYSGCEVDQQGAQGICHFVKLNGLTGQPMWEQQIQCRKLNFGGKHFDGGLYCTPLLGKGDCADLIFANICQREGRSNADFTAFSKKTGEVVYRTALNAFAWSSPVAFLNEKGQTFIFTGDSSGNAYLIEGRTGKVLFREHMVNNFESSPVVIDNHLVVGSRGQEIYRFSIE
ncbi:MAG: PQQ-like beta-propeller repeat protein [Bacteroidaceae bacterium]|nr:PQQ-like beta-propeller repeat protein [Bacteroidaceae bacterium]